MTQDAPNASGTAPHPGPDPASMQRAQLLQDWVTIWQSEMAGLAVDREMQEALLRLGDAWAAQAQVATGLIAHWQQEPSAERAPGPAGADAAARAAAADAAPDGRDAVIERLLARVAELERRAGHSLADGPADTRKADTGTADPGAGPG